jgi:hypothetical protein
MGVKEEFGSIELRRTNEGARRYRAYYTHALTRHRAPTTFIRSTLTYDAATDRFQVWTSDGGNMSLAMEDLDALQRQGEAARTASRIGQIRARHEQATERCTECGHEERCHKLGEPEVSDNHVAIEVAPGACEADGCLCDEFRKPW